MIIRLCYMRLCSLGGNLCFLKFFICGLNIIK